jgi:hypothetical protein
MSVVHGVSAYCQPMTPTAVPGVASTFSRVASPHDRLEH